MTRSEAIRTTAAVLGFLAVFFMLPVAIFQGVKIVDTSRCHPLSLTSGSQGIDFSLGRCLHPLILPEANDSSITFPLANRGEETLTLSICGLVFPHQIFENGELVSQNIAPKAPHFNSAMHYKEFEIPPNHPEQTFRIEGSGVDSISAYLAQKAAMQSHRRIAIELNSFLSWIILSFGLLMLVVSIVHKRLVALEAAVLSVFVFCVLKISFQDTSAIGSVFFSIPAESFQLWDIATTIGFSLSLFLIYALFFDVQPKRIFYPVLGGYTLLMLINFVVTIFFNGENRLLPAILLYRVLLFVWILAFAVMNRKPFAKSILLLHAVSDGLIIYHVYLQNQPAAAGLSAFYIDLAFLAFSVQFLSALILFIYRTLVQSHDYNRLLMLRGLEHDLKIPLSVIKLNHQMMRRYSLQDDDPNGLRFAGAIDRALADLDGMLQNLRYHLENRPAAQKSGTTLAMLFQTLEGDFRAVSMARNAVFDIEIPAPALSAAIDPDVLKRILHNLLDNAFKHGGSELRVSLRAASIAGKAVITICDNGTGMTDSERRKSVRLFHKADPARSTPGLGLGLHVVRNQIRQNRGTLTIKSKKGEGTTIIVSLPFAPHRTQEHGAAHRAT